MEIRIINNIPGANVTFDRDLDGSYIVEISQESRLALGMIECGETVKIGNREYIVLEQLESSTAVICKEFAKEMEFGDSGDWKESAVREYCNGEFYNELAAAVGAENILKHTVDLLAQDGTGVGESSEEFVSLLTLDMYRKYRKYLPNYGKWWWLATRLNADDKDYARGVCCVDSSGVLSWSCCDYSGGVRPFCILKSSTLVS